MAALMKRVVKIEGPFNKNDELVDILVPGESYYYLGTPNREMDDAELLTMKWAYRIDAGPITPFQRSKYSKAKGKSKMSGMLPKDFAATNATVYAYFNRPSDDVSMRKTVQKAAAAAAVPATPAAATPAVAPTGAGILNEMKALVDRNIPYSQTGERAKLTPEGLKNLDCSETVAIYLHKLGVMPTLVAIHTGLMLTEHDFRNAIGSGNIDFVPGSNSPGFKPMRGDVFVWRNKGVGHTGIVFKYDAATDLVTILEAIGNVGSADEATNRTSGGTAKRGCSRTAVYKRAGKALNAHGGWIGYYRPKNFTKSL